MTVRCAIMVGEQTDPIAAIITPFQIVCRAEAGEAPAAAVILDGAATFEFGQTVAINSYLACGTYIACRHDEANACTRIQVLGVHTDGGRCERLSVPESVLVVGAGPIGEGAALFARMDGAAVTLIDTRVDRLERARTPLGFTDTRIAEPELADALRRATEGDMFDTVFDATGSLSAMRAILAYVAHGGSLVLVGVAPGDFVLPDPEFHESETALMASRNALAADFSPVIGAIRGGDIPTHALHTHSLIADDLPQLIKEANDVLKAIVSF